MPLYSVKLLFFICGYYFDTVFVACDVLESFDCSDETVEEAGTDSEALDTPELAALPAEETTSLELAVKVSLSAEEALE